ncbi:MAG: hypothetical protein JWM89_1810 [Acidimicrobiales bacterium]|nr:hypothetical protein [Acidimicrobiales bacterium]
MTEQILGALGVLLLIGAVAGLFAEALGATVGILVALLLFGLTLVWVAWVLHTQPVPAKPPAPEAGP